jgi:NAD(P)-dependent dehydrogenase (short-subunit alcohol dehydrogenase family)
MEARRGWSDNDIGDQSGRTAVVTGANAGIGYEIARCFAAHRARVVIACRNIDKGARAASAIRSQQPGAVVEVVRLDLASLESVRDAGREIRSLGSLDLLVNNAGIMEPPFQQTADGFELTFATNHLGPFLLTGIVLDSLLATPGSRVVTVSSEGHQRGEMNFEDLQFHSRRYRADAAYCQSKLANLLFTYELDRRLSQAGAGTVALACHPGLVLTNLYKTRSRLNRAQFSPHLRWLNSGTVQSAAMGALPALRAAVASDALGGEFYGPPGRGYVGYPVRVESSSRAHIVADQARLWEMSEELTGVHYGLARVHPHPS